MMAEPASVIQRQGKSYITLTFKADLTAVFVEIDFPCFLLKEERKRPASKSSISWKRKSNSMYSITFLHLNSIMPEKLSQ